VSSKHATYVCLGAACGAQVRLRAPAKTGPKRKPMGWELLAIRVQDGDTGIVREAQVVCCSKACTANLDEEGVLGRRLLDYLEAEPSPAVVRYECIRCDATAAILEPKHTAAELEFPADWTSVPLIARDASTSIVRMTTMPVCAACGDQLDADAPLSAQPAKVQAELKRLFGGITNDLKDEVLA
jgi:hypothetical protein